MSQIAAVAGCLVWAADPTANPNEEFTMDAWRALLTTDAGLYSLAGIIFMIGMGAFFYYKFRKFIRDEEAGRKS
ncbi:MAG TPA: DUF3149 domain-containing protein [Aquimonas sp.]|nr:DUF3149 domain-containing protein [Xanthomonadales bacterium]HRD72399.1 DUF3149 domain-containing protein [Aquimonas sp.]HRF53704.1 DUF3149 domain-containing protein [Aquimonas sp.]